MPKASILIVEDDASLSEILDYNLKQEGYQTRVARDGQQALREARLHAPDLVVLDHDELAVRRHSEARDLADPPLAVGLVRQCQCEVPAAGFA